MTPEQPKMTEQQLSKIKARDKGDWTFGQAVSQPQIDRHDLLSYCDELVRDKERLDWLIENVQFVDRRFPTPKQDRQAIDSALAAEKERAG